MSTVTLNLGGTRRLPMIRQNEAAECGLACLAMIAGYYGYSIDIATLRRRYMTSLRGMTLKSLIELADKLDLVSRPVEAPLELLERVRRPALIHWNMNHFVVLKAIGRNRFVIHDPLLGERVYTKAQFSQHFTGVVLELAPSNKFRKRKDKSPLELTELWGRIHGLKRNLVQIFLLSMILQIFALLSPFYLQLVVDEVIVNFDIELLAVLALGFAGITLINVTTHTLRGYVLLYFGSMLSFQMLTNLFRHLVRLPLDYFSKRHTGDIISRFDSMGPIREMLSEGLVAGIVDGLLVLTTFVMMFIYSPLLASVALAALLLYFMLRLLCYRPFCSAQEDVIISQASENTSFIETVRGILSLKLFGAENEREHSWQHKLAEVTNNRARLGKFTIWFQSFNQAIFGLEHVILVYLGARLIMAGDLSIGMMFAFMAYKRNFSDKASALVETVIEYRILNLHLQRVADIARSEQEEQGRDLVADSADMSLQGRLVIHDIHYSYSSDLPEILAGIELAIEEGDSAVIVGPSGCGKSTLLKLMTGLLKPQRGEVIVDGKPLSEYGLARYRRQIGVVMQEDDLFAGSIAENIAFFDRNIEMDRVWSVAGIAMIHDEIMAMPMQYESLVGDMGSALSGGQKQRLVLARALYRQPRILFLDEATAHLDPETEAAVNTTIAGLGITRILITHRSELISSAAHVWTLRDGKLERVNC